VYVGYIQVVFIAATELFDGDRLRHTCRYLDGGSRVAAVGICHTEIEWRGNACRAGIGKGNDEVVGQ
jgi:hypothetical protein